MSHEREEVLLLLELEHKNLALVLDILDQELSRIENGDDTDENLLSDIADYFIGFPDGCHHPKEDLIFDRLQAASPSKAAQVGGLKLEHENVAASTERLAGLVRRLQLEPDAARQALVTGGRDFLDLYRAHMRSEQAYFFPLAREVLTDDDWSEIDFEIFDEPDPVFGGSAVKRFLLLRDRIIQENAARDAGDAKPPS